MLTEAVREIGPGETRLAYAAMAELRTNLASAEEFARRVDDVQRREGYRLAGSFERGVGEPVAVAGFRVGNSLAWGPFLYVDDLVTREAFRGRGHAGALMDWLRDEGRRLGCGQVHLDSGSHRHDAHRFYLSHRMHIAGFHFSGAVGEPVREPGGEEA